jgi:U3 small nucleolar RNA-associated protein 7
LEHHVAPTRLEYLPYHFLLASCGSNGSLAYTDISIGTNVSKHRSKMGQCQSMGQNKSNGVLSLGHYNGTVTFWQPTMQDYAMKMLCHKNQINDICYDSSGNYMITCGNDKQVKVFDLRKLEEVYSYYTSGIPTSIDMSGSGVLGISLNSRVQLWKNPHLSKEKSPYMQHTQAGSTVNCVKFVPYEDILGFGHQEGYSTMVVPGAGSAYDALESNPFETTKQRREKEVRDLLDKLTPETIQLKRIDIGKIDENAETYEHKQRDPIRKKTMSGKQWSRLKNRNIIDDKTEKLKELLEVKSKATAVPEPIVNDPLGRFNRQVAK